MGIPELRAFVADPKLVALLDAQLATKAPTWNRSTGRRPSLRQAIAAVCDDSYRGTSELALDGELGVWIEAFNVVRADTSSFGRHYMKQNVKRLARPEAVAALLRLTEQPEASVRAEVFAALATLESSPAILDVMVRGVCDSSSKVRAVAIAVLGRSPQPAVKRLRAEQAAATGKPAALYADALAALGPSATGASSGDAALLEQLVDAWVATRQPEVADLIDLAATELPHDPISGRSAAEREIQWHALAKTRPAASLSSLLATPWPTQWRDGLERLKVLADWDDPRIATALRLMMESPPYHSQAANSLYFAVMHDLTRIPDARQREPLAALSKKLKKQWQGYLYMRRIEVTVDGSQFEATLQRAPATALGRHAAVVERARATLQTAASRASSNQHTEADLLAEIYANPASDPARLVYADVLVERGDPRGELIVLQCTATPTEDTAKRARALIRQHEEQLVGPLGPYIQKGGRAFDRGFLSACVCEARAFARGAKEPAWATVREISFTRNATDELHALVRDARGASLRVLHGLSEDDATTIASKRIEEISLRPSEAMPATFPKLPALRRLGLIRSRYRVGCEAAMVAGPLWKRLERFAINDGFARIPLWLERLATAPKLTELVLVSEQTDGQLADVEGWSVTLRPGTPPTLAVELHTKAWYASPLEAIAALPRGAVEFVISPSVALSANLEIGARLEAVRSGTAVPSKGTPRRRR